MPHAAAEVSPATCVVQSTRSFEVSRRVPRAGVKRERGAAGSPANASAAPATVSACGRIQPATVGASLREGDTPDPTSPETGLDRWWEMPRGAVGDRRASSLHFLLQPESGTRGRMPREETLKRSIIAALVAATAPLAFAQTPEEPAVVVTATRFPESRLEAPVGMIVIGVQEIARDTARTLPELLSHLANVHVRHNR